MDERPFSPIDLSPCPKGYTKDLDKMVSPEETLAFVQARLRSLDLDILKETRRVDVGRLGIPVYMSLCGADALAFLPTRKQMGKGSSPAQAQASAVMELVERFSFFTFFARTASLPKERWKAAKSHYGSALLPVSEMLRSVQESMISEQAEAILDLLPWTFYPALDLLNNSQVWLPLEWFRLLNEFNGSSAGNSDVESLFQGLCEVVERHVCWQIDRDHLVCPTIDPHSCTDPTLVELLAAFEREGVHLLLKDFSLGYGLPTIGAVAWDAATFPQSSEIVFTAGTASSPAKAAIRTVTEIAQLGGDFCTKSCYEASGLSKYHSLEAIDWLLQGPTCRMEDIHGLEAKDILDELLAVVRGLAPYKVYALSLRHPKLDLPAHYTIVPGLEFRERDANQSLGLFVGRRLVEEADLEAAQAGLAVLATIYGEQAHFLPFFRGQLNLREGDLVQAEACFATAVDRQPDEASQALSLFYHGYVLTQQGNWQKARSVLQRACALAPEVRDYISLLGVAHFKTGAYAEAESCFISALAIDKGSAMDLANLGMSQKQQGKMAEAKEHLSLALSLDASLDFARKALAELEKD
ncbi:MAG: YcaO-like family protein [Desulfovibrio sp.]|nr:YcaO-like family protein [Desulfovibrio sp.]